MISRSYKLLVVAMAAAVVVAMALMGCSEAELVRLKNHPAGGTGQLGSDSSKAVVKGSELEYLSFLVVGDWGRKGLYNQSLVAAQMGKVGEKLNIEFIISTGDNFYDNGLTGVRDPAFLESFSNIYTGPSLQKKWYNVLGNHDYRGDAKAQLSRDLRKRDRRWVCQRSYILEAGRSVDIFMVDTTPFVDKYFTDPGEHNYDWRDVTPRKDYLSTLLKDLNSALKESSAMWKIVVGHHTIFSAGHHGNTDELLVHLLPVLKENNVDVYINGHDHCLERISKNNIEFVTSGGGSKAWRGDEKAWDPKELKFYNDGQGFLSAQLSPTGSFNFQFYDVFGQPIHRWEMSKQRRRPVVVAAA